jgi:hypothetical protein
MSMQKHESELARAIARVLARLSEEAIVILAIVATFAYAHYSRANDIKTFLILLAALGVYLSLRLLRLLDRN